MTPEMAAQIAAHPQARAMYDAGREAMAEAGEYIDGLIESALSDMGAPRRARQEQADDDDSPRSVASRVLGELPSEYLREAPAGLHLEDGTVVSAESQELILRSLDRMPTDLPTGLDQAAVDRFFERTRNKPAGQISGADIFYESDEDAP